VLAGTGVAAAQDAPKGQAASASVPGLTRIGKNVGATDSAQVIDVVLWLKVHNRAQLDSLAADVYNKDSPNYHKWLSAAGFEAKFAPTAKEAATVSQFLSSKGLSVVEVGAKNMFVRARGTVGTVNKAFNVKLNNFELNGRTYYANTSEPAVEGPAGELTAAVAGLHNLTYTHPYEAQLALPTKHSPGSAGAKAPDTVTPPPISSECFSGPLKETFNNAGSYPVVTVHGNGYAASAGSGGCGYTPPEIQAAYNLTSLYNNGLDGTGQTIAIIDWCGSPTIAADANTFSEAYGLPPIVQGSNFNIVYPSTLPTCGAPDPEINIDVEWAHAIAPGANIDLVVPPSASFADVDTAEYYAVINGLGSVISGSYGSEELYTDLTDLQTENLINELAAVRGISANFSSGDSGDFTFDLPQYFSPSVSAPADSPYATAVGGVSVGLDPSNSITLTAGWGTNVVSMQSGGYVCDPPTECGFFNYGSGGGPSAVYAKPAFQKGLKGTGRQVPDIAWLADPFTGAVIVISEPFVNPPQEYVVYGGTSLACPMFSGLWAIANQAAGASLGQASQYVYTMPAGAITDVVPVASNDNVASSFEESPTVTDKYPADEMAGPLETTTHFISAIWNYPLAQDTVYVITFGTDSGLKTKTGWDNVTGLGVPNPPAFINAVIANP
jgi:subtilase family serine protease